MIWGFKMPESGSLEGTASRDDVCREANGQRRREGEGSRLIVEVIT